MTSPDWFAGIVFIGITIVAYLLAKYAFNPEKENCHK